MARARHYNAMNEIVSHKYYCAFINIASSPSYLWSTASIMSRAYYKLFREGRKHEMFIMKRHYTHAKWPNDHDIFIVAWAFCIVWAIATPGRVKIWNRNVSSPNIMPQISLARAPRNINRNISYDESASSIIAKYTRAFGHYQRHYHYTHYINALNKLICSDNHHLVTITSIYATMIWVTA